MTENNGETIEQKEEEMVTVSELIDQEEKNDEDDVEGKTELIYFTSPWCTNCKMVTPIMEELSSEYTVVTINIATDEGMKIAVDNHIMTTPTVIVRRYVPQAQDVQGFIDHTFVGGFPKEVLTNYLELGVLPKQ